MFGIPGGWEWIIILIIALLIFGKKLPSTMRSIGKGVVEFKKGLKGVKDEVDEVEEDIKKIDDKDADVK
jgi:sec-independent protein translocase protein TatA